MSKLGDSDVLGTYAPGGRVCLTEHGGKTDVWVTIVGNYATSTGVVVVKTDDTGAITERDGLTPLSTIGAGAIPAYVRRFAITHIDDRITLRRLTFAQQGRETYETRAAGEAALATFRNPGGLDRVLSSTELATLKVSEVVCYAGHHDPVRYYVE